MIAQFTVDRQRPLLAANPSLVNQFTLDYCLVSILQGVAGLSWVVADPGKNWISNTTKQEQYGLSLAMNKYFYIINSRTLAIVLLCVLVTYLCIRFDFRYDIDITLFSIAVIFPLVFTIREAFKRRDNALKYLSVFKSSMNAIYHCFENNVKIDAEKKFKIKQDLMATSQHFFDALRSDELNLDSVRKELDGLFDFVNTHRDAISFNLAVKIYRLLKDTQESIENVFGLKMHGTPVSLRAYCLVFVYIFPFVYIPAIVYNLNGAPQWVVYALAIVHGFILISLYNVQSDMEDPFDQVGLDDIHLDEFRFMNVDRPEQLPPKQLPKVPEQGAE